MLKIGVAQIKNSIDLESNFTIIKRCLLEFKKAEVDLIVFPECSLSGFSSQMMEATPEALDNYFSFISTFSRENDIAVLLPTAIKEESIYNSGVYFHDGQLERFYKIGLTESEKSFFKIPSKYKKQIFSLKNYKFIPLLCFEAEQEAYTYFQEKDVDFILWPGYWGWTMTDNWSETKASGEESLIFKNTKVWNIPLIQSNFSYNDFGDKTQGPHGLSVVIDKGNKLFYRASYELQECFVVEVNEKSILSVYSLTKFR